jgi:hypothetical protein
MSTIFHLYFISNFNNELFVSNNEAFLREYAINKYVYKSHAISLYQSTIEMINQNKYTQKLTIHKDFSKEILVNIFRPFLYYYFISLYDIKGTHKVSNYKQILYLKLKKFYQYNTAFGRKIIQLLPLERNGAFTLSPNRNMQLQLNLDLSTTASNTDVNQVVQTTQTTPNYKRKAKTIFNSKHLGFHNININESEIEDDLINEASLLYYFQRYINSNANTEQEREELDDTEDEETLEGQIEEDDATLDDDTLEGENEEDEETETETEDEEIQQQQQQQEEEEKYHDDEYDDYTYSSEEDSVS